MAADFGSRPFFYVFALGPFYRRRKRKTPDKIVEGSEKQSEGYLKALSQNKKELLLKFFYFSSLAID